MKGLRIQSHRPWRDVFSVLLPEFTELYWLLNLQSGPFSITNEPNFEELDLELDKYYVDVPGFENSDTGLWAPGVLPRFADLLVEDEHSYLTGLRGDRSTVVANAIELDRLKDSTSRFELLEQVADIFFVKPYFGCWEMYSPKRAWLDRVRNGQPTQKIDSATHE